MKHLLVFDLSNLCYIGAAGVRDKINASVEDYFAASLQYLRAQYRYFKPDQVIFACDHESPYWRMEHYPQYKANRVDNPFKQKIRQVIRRFKTENEHLCIEYPGCEADDVIYALCHYTVFQITIVSSDGDFEQLISPRVRVFNPGQFGFRPRPRDIAFNLFVKCVRGDRGDNIDAIVPMITLRRLQEAYGHPEPMHFLEQHYRFSPDLKQKYDLNRLLIDLEQLPPHLKQALKESIETYFVESHDEKSSTCSG